VKITKSQLKQIIKEELSVVLEQQSPEDLERQAELERKADRGPLPRAGRDDRHEDVVAMLTKLTDMVGTLPSIITAEIQRLLREP
jgi:hypothetical protein